jgi:hypothetical protein
VTGSAALALVAVMGLAIVSRADASPGVTLVVAADGKATANNCNSNTVTPYTTVSAAVAAASAGDTVKVCAGAYDEDVTVDKALTLKGAKYGDSVSGRTFGSANESTITGLVTIQAEGVKLEGFSLTNPGEALGVLVKKTANDTLIKKNIVKTVGSATFASPVVGVYLELGPDRVRVAGNAVSDIQSQNGSAQGVLVGDSTSADPSVDIRIDNNKFTDIKSANKGAYGVQLNNGASNAPSATGYTEAEVRGNTINNLTGNWVHAIGLEGETPYVVVSNNVVSDLTDSNPVPQADVVGVFFEDNLFFMTGEVNQNSLDVGATGFGIAVHPALAAHYATLGVDGTCNWWGAKSGPSTVGSGTGSMVSSGVDFEDFLKSDNLDRGCDDDHHGGHHSWHDHDNDDWHKDD